MQPTVNRPTASFPDNGGTLRNKELCYCSLDCKNSKESWQFWSLTPSWPFFFSWCCPISAMWLSSGPHSFSIELNAPCRSRSKTSAPSSLGLLLVPPRAASGGIHPIESTPNKVSQQRARSPAERCVSRSNFTWSQPKYSLVHLSFSGRFPPVRHINESQLFLGFTIRCSIFGPRSIACKTLCRSKLCVWSIIICLYRRFQLLGFFVRLYASGQFNKAERFVTLFTNSLAHFLNFKIWKMG